MLLPWCPWSTAQNFQKGDKESDRNLDDVTVLIPARNEEAEIAKTLQSLNKQATDSQLRVVLVDDQSEDKTVEVAKGEFAGSMIILKGKELSPGWTGKLWALEQGLKEVKTKYTLLLDADIQLDPGVLPQVVDKMEAESLDYLSLMVRLRMKTVFEKLLLPAYIYFFKLLYPFSLANKAQSKRSAGAGGFVLVKTDVLKKSGAFASMKDAIIDDCELAKLIKTAGYRIWIGLTRDVSSHREYQSLGEIWSLVSRSAYTYLRYNPWYLLGCSFVLTCAFLVLPVAVFYPGIELSLRIFFAAGLLAMLATYSPTLRYYRIGSLWRFSLLLAGPLYMMMVWTSAWKYYTGARSQWKGRRYDVKDYQSNEDEPLKKAS